MGAQCSTCTTQDHEQEINTVSAHSLPLIPVLTVVRSALGGSQWGWRGGGRFRKVAGPCQHPCGQEAAKQFI